MEERALSYAVAEYRSRKGGYTMLAIRLGQDEFAVQMFENTEARASVGKWSVVDLLTATTMARGVMEREE